MLDEIIQKFDRLTTRAIKVLRIARDYAIRQHHAVVTPEHILWALATIEQCVSRRALEYLGIDLAENIEELELLIGIPSESHDVVPASSRETEIVLQSANAQAQLSHHNFIASEHLVMGMLLCDYPAAKYLRSRGVELTRYQEVVLGFYKAMLPNDDSYTCPDAALKGREPIF